MTFAPLALALLLIARPGGLEEGRRLIAEERFDSAVVMLESWRAHNPESDEAARLLVHALRVRARRAHAADDLAAALRDLARAAQLAPSDSAIITDLATVHAIAGQRLMARGDTEGAIAGFERALELEPQRRDIRRAFAAIRIREGAAFEAAGLELEAIRHWRRAIELDSGLVEAHLLLGQTYHRRAEFELARHHLRLARQLAATAVSGLDELLARVDREFETTRTYQTMEAEGFLVRFEGGHRPDLFYRILPLLRDSRERIARVLERTPRRPVTVIIYAGDAFQRSVDAPDWAVGLFDGKIRLRESEINRTPDYLGRIVRHEMTHAILEEIAPGRIPAWIHEGLAGYFEIERWDRLQDAAATLAMIQARRSPRLRDLTPPFARLGSGIDIRGAYGISAAAIRHLALNHGEPTLATLVTLLAAGRSAEQAIDSIVFLDLDAFQKRVEDWVVWEYAHRR